MIEYANSLSDKIPEKYRHMEQYSTHELFIILGNAMLKRREIQAKILKYIKKDTTDKLIAVNKIIINEIASSVQKNNNK